MRQFGYLIVRSDGVSYELCPTREACEGFEVDRKNFQRRAYMVTLPEVLRDGWRPVRETALGSDGSFAYCLVLLEREGRDERPHG